MLILRGEGGRGERSFTVVFNHYNRELAQNKIWEGVKNCLSSSSHNGEGAGSWALMFFFSPIRFEKAGQFHGYRIHGNRGQRSAAHVLACYD